MARRKIVSVEPSSWVLASALQDYYRKVLPLGDSHRPHGDLQALMETPPMGDPRAPRGSYIPTDQDNVVLEALEELEERDRTILELVYGAEMSLRQVEQLTGIPKTTVARRRDLAPQLFAEILKRKMPKLADKYHLD